MKQDNPFSEEQLSAFVDGELDSEERSRLLNESAKFETLDRRLCQQRKLKELVILAYDGLRRPNRESRKDNSKWSLLKRLMVASILIYVGLAIGMLSQQKIHQNERFLQTSIFEKAAENYILHLVSGEPEKMRTALLQAKLLLGQSNKQQIPVQVEIITNEKGLNLLRSDITPFAEEIKALADSNIVFYACSRAIQRMEEKGIKIQLVPNANAQFTALDRVVTRMQDGWTYLKI